MKDECNPILEGNTRRHHERVGWAPSPFKQAAEVDPQKLRIQLAAEAARERGLSYEERIELKRRIAEIQRPKEKRERLIDDRDARAKRRTEKKAVATGPGLFICGCNPNDEHIKRYYTNIEPDGQGGQRLTFIRKDAQGNMICPIHAKRLYGWATSKEKGAPPEGYRPSSKEVEAFSHPDLRNIRDPVEVGQEELARRAAGRNGAGEALELVPPTTDELEEEKP